MLKAIEKKMNGIGNNQNIVYSFISLAFTFFFSLFLRSVVKKSGSSKFMCVLWMLRVTDVELGL